MASSIYNHKHLQPAGAATQGPSLQSHHSVARLNDAFETIRQEYDQLLRELDQMRTQRDEFENKLTGQVNELNIIRSTLYALEDDHRKVRAQYEEDLRKVQAEFAQYKARVEGITREGIASLGRGDRDRDRDRERDRDRDRDRERDRDRDMRIDREAPRDPMGLPGPPPRADAREGLGLGRALGMPGAPPPGVPPEGQLGGIPHAAPVGLGVGAGPGGGGGYDFYRDDRGRERERDADRIADRSGRMDSRMVDRDMREREMRERERERMDRERERDREMRDRERDVKRVKTEQTRGKMDRIDPYSPSMQTLPHQTPHASHQSISLAPAPSGPQQSPSTSHPNAGPSGPGVTGGPSGSTHQTPKIPPAAGPGSYGPHGTPSSAGPQQPPTPSTLHNSGPPSTSGPGAPPVLHNSNPSTLPSGSNGLPPPPAALPPPPSQLPPPPPSAQQQQQQQPPPPPLQDRDVTMSDGYAGGPVVDLSLDLHSVPPELKKEGQDWFAVFGPAAIKDGKKLNVDLVHTLTHESVVCCVKFSADGKYLATGCNRSAQIYDTKSGAKTCVLVDEDASKTGDLYIRSVCFSPDGKYLATGAEDKQIRIWDIAKKRIRNIFEGHQQEIYSLDFSKDGRFIVSGSGDKTAKIWDMAEQCLYKSLSIDEPDNVDAGVTSVCISPDGTLVAAGSLDTVVRIWDVQTGKLVERLKGHRDSVYSVAFTPDGRGLVSGSLDKTLKYWDVQPINERRKNGLKNGAPAVLDRTSACMMNFTGHKDYVLSVAVSHDGQWVVSGSKDRGVQFWDAKSAVVQCMLQGHKNSVISIDLSPVGSLLATGSGDWQARIWSYNPMPANSAN